YSDMKERKEASLDVIRVRNSLNEKEEALIKIKSNYGSAVKTTKDTKLFINEDGKYKDVGSINKDVILELESIDDIGLDNKCFKLVDSDYYVSYKDVIPTTDTIN